MNLSIVPYTAQGESIYFSNVLENGTLKVVMQNGYKQTQRGIAKYPDTRRQYGNMRHNLDEILIIGLCSVICCGEDFDDMEDFSKGREEWLRGFLELPNGIPATILFGVYLSG